MKGDRERYLEAGMDDYMSKPIQIQRLLETIARLTSLSAGPRPAAESEKKAISGIDEDSLLAGVGGDRKLLRELASLFLRDSPGMLARIKRALAARHAGELAQAAHALKGSVGMFSTKNAFQAARTLEAMGKKKSLPGAQRAYGVLERELSQLAEVVTALRKKLRAR